MQKEHPEYVYKYRKFDKQTIAALCSDELFFSSPTAFNDPLESTFFVDIDSEIETLREILTALVTQRVAAKTKASLKNASVSEGRSLKHVNSVAENAANDKLNYVAYNATNPEYEGTEEENEKFLLAHEVKSELVKQYDRGVCCFALSYNNPLLWSHYGDEHYGLCVGYNQKRNPTPELYKVEYGGDCVLRTSTIEKAIIKNDVKAMALIDKTILLNKSNDWNYEQEWRLFSRRGLTQSPLRLTDITFGLRCPSPIQHAVVKALEDRQSSIDFYEIYKVDKSLNLERRKLDLGELGAYYPRVAKSGAEIFGDIPPK